MMMWNFHCLLIFICALLLHFPFFPSHPHDLENNSHPISLVCSMIPFPLPPGTFLWICWGCLCSVPFLTYQFFSQVITCSYTTRTFLSLLSFLFSRRLSFSLSPLISSSSSPSHPLITPSPDTIFAYPHLNIIRPAFRQLQ
ncbi:hypothetical protein BS47DRAFT_991294 [Hydnum rufescens UP504]|uniref:Uncharacterized protein n=1 Tax=Hydnum rufescens UP504 TaxID=1448309 RepID=A0A9P6AWJ2_9AGAM|nr:hypothetical protein BS47DRAFT_991294 [Hydnum rufescens UP504]